MLICGVVEGFYGRPWKPYQRKELFERLAAQHLNTYMYAPKDDRKHRAHWRETYSEDELRKIVSFVFEQHSIST